VPRPQPVGRQLYRPLESRETCPPRHRMTCDSRNRGLIRGERCLIDVAWFRVEV
jgi:hypothetical protein